jgi:hypothetical protein
MQEALGLRQREVFCQDVVHSYGRVLITANDAYGHGQLLQPLLLEVEQV